jgi:transcriptional regulator with XRE-family HTH domain
MVAGTDDNPPPRMGEGTEAMGYTSFARHLRQQRIRRGLAQAAVADKSELSLSLVSRLESGTRQPTRNNLDALCRGLQLSSLESERLYKTAGFVYNVNVAPLQRIVRDGLVGYEFDEDIINHLDATWQSLIRLACATQEARNGVSGTHRVSV